MQTNSNTNMSQFYDNVMLNQPLPPTPGKFRHSPISHNGNHYSMQMEQPHSPARPLPTIANTSKSNGDPHVNTFSSFASIGRPNGSQESRLTESQSNNKQPIVGPSDHYGIYPMNQSGGLAASQSNDHDGRAIAAAGQQATRPSQETKVCVIVDSRTPVIIKVPIAPVEITLAHLKAALPAIDQPNYKYFFKSNDSEFGIVKEEIQEDDCQLPTYRNRVVAWIVTPNGNLNGDDLASRMRSETTDTCNQTYTNTSYDDRSSSMITTDLESTTSYFTETDDDSLSCSNYSETTCDTLISQRRAGNSNQRYRSMGPAGGKSPVPNTNNHHHHHHSHRTTSPYRGNGHHNHHTVRKSNAHISSQSSSSSTSSTSSASSESYSDRTAVHCVTVQLVLTNENFLGLHVYQNSVNGIDEGIYVDGVAENSAVALDGRIEPGDKLIQVNETNLEELKNEESVEVLKEAVIRRGPLKLVVAKFVETNNNKTNDPIAGLQPIHPIDTAAWVAHAQAVTMPNHHREHTNSATSSPSFGSNAQDTDCIRPASTSMGQRLGSGLRLNRATTDLKDLVEQMKMPSNGLEIKNRDWLKIQIPMAFLGSDLLTWLERNVYGWTNERETKKFASRLLKEGHIRDPISKKSFSSKSYYTFADGDSVENSYEMHRLHS